MRKKYLFLIIVISFLSTNPTFGIYLNFEQVDSASLGTGLLKLYDMNGDSIDEVIFKGNSEYYLGTHRFFIYSFSEDSMLFESEPVGGIIKDLCPSDINNDGAMDIIYSYDSYAFDTHNLVLAYGPDFHSHHYLFSRVNANTLTNVRQMGTFRENQKPIYFMGTKKIYVIGDDLEFVDSLFFSSNNRLCGYTIDRIAENDYWLSVFSKKGGVSYAQGYISYFNEQFDTIDSQTVFAVGEYPYQCIASGGFLRNVYSTDGEPIYQVFTWKYISEINPWRYYMEKMRYGGGTVHTIAFEERNYYDEPARFRNSFSVDYIGDGDNRFCTLQIKGDGFSDTAGFILRNEANGDSIGYGTTEHLTSSCNFGNWDTEEGKELFVSRGNNIRVYKLRESTTDVDDDNTAIPDKFELFTNYPNPFNPVTTIEYALPHQSEVRLEVYNILGQRIKTLIYNIQKPGNHSINWNASGLSSGIYFYRLTAGDKTTTKRMTLLK